VDTRADEMATLTRAVAALNRCLDRDDDRRKRVVRTCHARGPREDAVLALTELTQPGGLKAADIALRVDYKVTNIYKVLHGMLQAGLLERVPQTSPQHWRLARQRREGIQTFMAMAGTVLAGQWTTCADISLAYRGDTSAAWMVCWAAARLPDFPAPHRVLLECGRLHSYGHEHERPRPGLVVELLTNEGLRFDGFGRADRARRVAWDELKSRLVAAQAAEAESIEPDADIVQLLVLRGLGSPVGQDR
jgi:hypothetical protein